MAWRHFHNAIRRLGSGSARNGPAEAARRLRQFIDLHGKISQEVEPGFIDLGNELQAVYTDAGELSRQTVGTIELLGRKDGGVMADLRQLAETALQDLRCRNREIGHNLEVAQVILTRLDHLVAQAEILHKLGLYLGVVGLNIGVESTRAAEATGMFSGMAEDVRQLAGKIRLVATEMVADCEGEQHGQQAVCDRTAEGLTILNGLAQEAELAVKEAVACIEEIMGRVLAALADANEHTKDISSQIGEVVVRIQLHDSMSQRIGHIVQALSMVIATLDRAVGLGQGDRLQELAVARRLILLQAGQIERIIKETEEAYRNSRLAFQTIDERVAALGHCFSVVSETAVSDQGSEAAADPLLLLQTALGRLSHLLAEGLTMIEQLNDSARQTSLMAGRLVGHMKIIEAIGSEVHVKALNTIIMAAHLGSRGRTMEVLARETKSFSDQTSDYVSNVTAVHAGIAESVQALQIDDKIRADNDKGEELLSGSVKIIAETISCFNSEAAAAGKQAEVLRRAIARADGGLEFLCRLATELSGHYRQLMDIAELITPIVGRIDSGLALEEAGQLEAIYTMDKERKLHAAMLGGERSAFQGGKDDQQGATGGDIGGSFSDAPNDFKYKSEDRDDNIELF